MTGGIKYFQRVGSEEGVEVICDREVDFFEHCTSLIERAWYIRQISPQKSRQIINSIDLSGFSVSSNPSFMSLYARSILIKSEINRLFACFDGIITDCERAEEIFLQANDAIGVGDCCILLSDLFLSYGGTRKAQEYILKSISFFGNDTLRRCIAEAKLAHQQQYDDPRSAESKWIQLYNDDYLSEDAGVRAYVFMYRGSISFQGGDFPAAIRNWQKAFDEADICGARWVCIQVSMMIGSAFANLYDLPTAIEWKEKAHDLARETGWPEAMGTSLSSLAETITSIKDFYRAKALFKDAMPYLDRLSGTRRHAISYIAYGNLSIVLNEYDVALYWLQRANEIVMRIGHSDLSISTGSGIASALLGLGRLSEAGQEARRTCDIARKSSIPYYEIEALRVLASVQRAEDGAPSRSITTLEAAIAMGETLGGLTIRAEILDLIARDYEAIGDYQKALHYERRARDSWQRNFDQQNGARILAMQVRFDTARAKAEAEHHRELAESEAQRAATLDEANQILERLGQVGQEITARLDYEGVFQTIYGHIKELMPADFLSIGLVDEDRQIIDVRYRVEDGVRLSPREVALGADSLVALCVREGRELLSRVADERPPILVPGTRPMNTLLLRPLSVGERCLGVISVQSEQDDAYGDRERRIFSTLCAYSAIALSNAETYDQLERAVGDLREALHRLVQQEKMAALGQLVAGVAHEVNTPLGVTLSAVSLLHDNIRNLQETLGNGGLTRSTLTEHLQTGLELSSLAQRNVVRASDMIRSFKEVAVDRGSDDRRVFDLGDYLREIANLMKAKLTGKGSQVELDVGLIQMDTYPGALAQTITNLLANVADHAYGPDDAGPVRLWARQVEADMVEITVSDEGRGLDRETLEQAFDPFFTTNRAAGHMGLGLHVAYNQVTQRLGGRITLRNREGGGTEATICIPRELSSSSRPGPNTGAPPLPTTSLQ